MPRKCFIKNCRSNIANSSYTPTFSFPPQDHRYDQWYESIASNNDYSNEPEPDDTICIKHFEEKFVCRYVQAYDANFQKKSIQRTKLCLIDSAIPTINLNIEESGATETKLDAKGKPKRGSSGLANLQKARQRKMLRRERMKNLLKRRAVQKSQKLFENYDISKDYFLGQREMTAAEKLIIPLRLTSLVKRLHDGSNLCKNPPADSNSFRHIEGLSKSDENPLNWKVDETFKFVKYVSSVKSVAKILRAEEIDGEALLNLTLEDLINLHIDASTAENLMKVLTQLRKEIIERFINV
jgi:hypothetical protein